MGNSRMYPIQNKFCPLKAKGPYHEIVILEIEHILYTSKLTVGSPMKRHSDGVSLMDR